MAEELNVAWLDPGIWPDAGNGMYVEVGPDGPDLSKPVVWVNTEPNDVASPEGRFERYTGSPSDYHFKMRPAGLMKDGKFVAKKGDGLVPDVGVIPDAASATAGEEE